MKDRGLVRYETGYSYSRYPIVDFVAEWKGACDRISFRVDGETFCEVLIDVDTNLVVYPPVSPKLVGEDYGRYDFLGWNVLEGEYLSGIAKCQIVCSRDG